MKRGNDFPSSRAEQHAGVAFSFSDTPDFKPNQQEETKVEKAVTGQEAVTGCQRTLLTMKPLDLKGQANSSIGTDGKGFCPRLRVRQLSQTKNQQGNVRGRHSTEQTNYPISTVNLPDIYSVSRRKTLSSAGLGPPSHSRIHSSSDFNRFLLSLAAWGQACLV